MPRYFNVLLTEIFWNLISISWDLTSPCQIFHHHIGVAKSENATIKSFSTHFLLKMVLDVSISLLQHTIPIIW